MLAGDTMFGYPQRWDLGSAAGGSVLGTTGQPYNLTLNSSIGYFEWNNLTVQPPLSNIIVQAGNLGVVGSTSFGDPNATLVLEAGAGTTFWGPSVYVHKGVDFQNGATIQNASGANVMNGAMTLEAGFCTFNIGGGTTLTVSNVLSGPGTFYDIGGTGTTVLAGNSPSYAGTVLVVNGQLTLNGSVGGPVTTQGGTTLAGSGSAAGLVDVSGAFVPGGAGTAGTFTAGGLTLENGATLTMDLGPTTTVGSGANDLITVNGNLTVINNNNITINPLTGTLANGTYTLFTYTGSLSGSFGMASTVASSRYTFTLDTSVAHQVRLIVSGLPNLLEWNNGANNGQWDVQSSFNWSNLTSHAEDQFFTSDAVLLDDSITNAAHPTTSIVIGSGQVVAPSVLTNNSTTNYSISGAGKISGGGSIVKLGTSTLNLSTTNDFTGNVTVRAGTLQINGQLQGSVSPVGAASGTVFVTNGATLIVNLTGGYPSGDIGFAAKPLVVSGSGANGLGVIQNNGNPIYNDGNTLTGLGQSVTLTGNTTIGGTARWDWGYPGLSAVLSTGGSNYNFTAIQSGYAQWMELTIDTNLGNFDYISTASTPQTWQVAGMGGSLGNPTNTLTVHSNVLMYVVHGNTTAGDSGYAKVIHLLPTVEFRFQPSGGAGDYRLATSFVLESNATISFYSGTGGSGSGTVVNGAVKLNGLAHFQTGDAPLTFSNVISGAGGFFWDNYNNNMIFTAANTYQGITDIRSGRDLVLVGGGSISGSTNISLAASATLDVSGRTDKTLTLVAGQTLQGSGTVDGNLVVSSSATVSTGTASAIGTLTVTNAVTLSGTTVMKLNKTGSTADEISGASSIHYGGTLSLSNIGGTLAAGDSFTLFSAGSYAGSFTAITPSTPGAGLAWDTSGLSSGKIAIKAASVPPTIGAITVSAGRVVISGRNNTGAGGGPYHVLSSVNVGAPLGSWTVLTNGTFDGSGNFSSTNAVGTNAEQFYIIREP
jgi:fibronectin-binding autotransporter adhesin